MADHEVDAEVLGERRHLLAVAFRMLGTLAEAEDAVQEAYVRWYRMSQEQRDAVEVPRAWLTRVTSRLCLDVLGSARVRRERYVGPWLPEPVPTLAFADSETSDPADRVTLDDSISMALLVVLESMTPAERVTFVLHEVFAVPFGEIAEIVGRTPAACRQLASSARRRLHGTRAGRVPQKAHDASVRAFAAAARSGNLAALLAVLDPNVILQSDGGGVVSAARRPVRGADKVARFVLGVLAKNPAMEMLHQETPDGLGCAMWVESQVTGVVTMEVIEGRVTNIRIVVNPAKLTLWN